MHDRGTLTTVHASKYLRQLCKHFAHKVAVTYSDHPGHAALPPGPAVMTATDTTLTVEVTAETAEGLAQARGIIDSHLERFAFRESVSTLGWSSAAQVADGDGATQRRAGPTDRPA